MLLDHVTPEELASKKVRGHEGSIFRHSDLIRTELHPICQLKHANQNTTAIEMYPQPTEICKTCPWQQINTNDNNNNRKPNYIYRWIIILDIRPTLGSRKHDKLHISNKKAVFRFQLPENVDNFWRRRESTKENSFCVIGTAENWLTLFQTKMINESQRFWQLSQF